MKPIEQVYEGIDGVGRKNYNGIEFIICPVNHNGEELVKSYVEGGVGADKAFMLPAIKVGMFPNPDNRYRVSILNCHNENGNVVIDSVEEFEDDQKIVFFDTDLKKFLIFYKDLNKSLMSSKTLEHVVGPVTNDIYFPLSMWKFIGDQGVQEPT